MWFVVLLGALLSQGTPPGEPVENAPRAYTVSAVTDAGACKITIHPNAPWLLKPTTPFQAVLQTADALAFAKQAFTEKDYVDAKAMDKTVLIRLTSPTPVDASVKAALNFFLCTDQVCQRYKDTAECKFTSVAQAR